jgi:hypothetical protein
MTSFHKTKGEPFTYGTRTTGTHDFDNVQLLNASAAGLGVQTGFLLDDAKTTLTIAAAIPRGVFSIGLPSLAVSYMLPYLLVLVALSASVSDFVLVSGF